MSLCTLHNGATTVNKTMHSKTFHFKQFSCIVLSLSVGTVDNHGNCDFRQMSECRDFAKMPCFFCQNAVVLRFHKNILFLISII